MIRRKDINALLDLDGLVIEQAGGYWTKFAVTRAAAITKQVLHGLRYSLTLHDKYGNRIMGFDNAHAVTTKSHDKRYAQIEYDHHRYIKDEGLPYQFINAYQLLKDFWSAVDNILKELQIEKEEECV